ncbi:MAG: hypothetical protein ACXWL5_01200 [Candidatus Chromulinivorax sp.]
MKKFKLLTALAVGSFAISNIIVCGPIIRQNRRHAYEEEHMQEEMMKNNYREEMENDFDEDEVVTQSQSDNNDNSENMQALRQKIQSKLQGLRDQMNNNVKVQAMENEENISDHDEDQEDDENEAIFLEVDNEPYNSNEPSEETKNFDDMTDSSTSDNEEVVTQSEQETTEQNDTASSLPVDMAQQNEPDQAIPTNTQPEEHPVPTLFAAPAQEEKHEDQSAVLTSENHESPKIEELHTPEQVEHPTQAAVVHEEKNEHESPQEQAHEDVAIKTVVMPSQEEEKHEEMLANVAHENHETPKVEEHHAQELPTNSTQAEVVHEERQVEEPKQVEATTKEVVKIVKVYPVYDAFVHVVKSIRSAGYSMLDYMYNMTKPEKKNAQKCNCN